MVARKKSSRDCLCSFRLLVENIIWKEAHTVIENRNVDFIDVPKPLREE